MRHNPNGGHIKFALAGLLLAGCMSVTLDNAHAPIPLVVEVLLREGHNVPATDLAPQLLYPRTCVTVHVVQGNEPTIGKQVSKSALTDG